MGAIPSDESLGCRSSLAGLMQWQRLGRLVIGEGLESLLQAAWLRYAETRGFRRTSTARQELKLWTGKRQTKKQESAGESSPPSKALTGPERPQRTVRAEVNLIISRTAP